MYTRDTRTTRDTRNTRNNRDTQQTVGCPYPASASNCHVTITSQAPSVPLISMDYLSEEYSNLPVGAKANYKCDDGYELFGSQVIQCLATGKWSAPAPSCALNIAHGKPTNQSSTIRGGDSRNAIDGKLITLHDMKYCTETKFEQSPWWQIDLLQAYEIRAVRILTRACCNPSTQLHDLEIRVGNQSTIQGNRLCAWNPTSLGKFCRWWFTPNEHWLTNWSNGTKLAPNWLIWRINWWINWLIIIIILIMIMIIVCNCIWTTQRRAPRGTLHVPTPLWVALSQYKWWASRHHCHFARYLFSPQKVSSVCVYPAIPNEWP